MEHFDIVLALSRMALETDDSRVKHQVQRLRDSLAKTNKEQATKLSRLLSRKERRHTLSAMALEEMRATAEVARLQLPGEALSRATPLPHDKETGAPLARIIFPEDGPAEPPILNIPLTAAIEDLLKEWKRTKELARIGASPNTRCLIYGAPGVGKTRLAQHLARRLDLPCVEARLDGLVSSFLGTTARNIGALFDFAKRYRCVLFLDEFDALAKARDDIHEVGEIKRVVNTLLQSLDARGSRGFTFAATNHEHLLDPAVWRRFEARIHIPKPEAAARKRILEAFLKPIRLRDVELRFLVWLTEGLSGADLETLVAGGKRYLVLHSEVGKIGEKIPGALNEPAFRGRTLLEAVRRQATLNARLFDNRQQELLAGPIEPFADALLEAGFTQKETGELLGKSQSAISRRQKVRAEQADGAGTEDGGH